MTVSDVQRTLQLVYAGVVPILGAVAWVVGFVLHGVGRDTAWVRRFVVYAIGVAIGGLITTSLATLQRQLTVATIVGAMLLLAVPLAIVLVLAMIGSRRAAGLVLAGVATPWAMVSTVYLVDVLAGGPWAPLLTAAMALLGLGLLLVGLALASIGDPSGEPDPSSAAGQPGSHRSGSMARTFMREAAYFVVGPSVVVPLAAATISGIVLSDQTAQVVVAIAAALIGTELEVRWIPPRQRPALEAFHWVGLGERARFKAETGSPIPSSIGALRAWLANHPETDVTRPWRIELLTGLGEYAQARAELARLDPRDPRGMLNRQSLATDLDWVQGGSADVDALAALAAETGQVDAPDRLAADGLVAWWQSRVRLAAMDPDWRRALGEFRPRLGAAANGIHARAMRRRILPLSLLVGLASVLFVHNGPSAAGLFALGT